MVAVPAMPEPLPAASAFVPGYWDEACRHLARRDRVMKKLIPKFGDARLQSNGDAFTTLARSIVGQQVSTKSAATGALLRALGATLGVLQQSPQAFLQAGAALTEAEIQGFIAARAQAKKDRNFPESDRIRDHLAAQGITLKDSAQGTTWVKA